MLNLGLEEPIMTRAQTASLILTPVKSVNVSMVSSWLRNAALPLLGILIFLGLWAVLAKNIDTSLGKFPWPKRCIHPGSSID